MENDKKIHLRFLHCSDIHLDSPFCEIGAEKGEQRRRSVRSAFARMMQYVRDREIHFVLISGDLFDTEHATSYTADTLVREFRNCPDTTFIIAPGKRDHRCGNLIYESGCLPSNCLIFDSDKLSRFDFNDINLTVYGWGFMNDTITENPLFSRQVDDVSRINIVLGYADLDGALDSGLCPISTADLKKFGADYYAFGSRHAASDFVSLGGSTYSYCGSLECMGFDDNGIGGANLIVADYNCGELSVDVRRMSFGHLKFETETLDITATNSTNEIINRITHLISEKQYGLETALRVELRGSVDPRFIIPKTFEEGAFGLYHFEMIDKTMPTYNVEKFKRDMTARGELYRTLLPQLESESEEERLLAARAFRLGLAALEGKDLS